MSNVHIIYRISETGYKKIKPEYINNENCFKNAAKHFSTCNWLVIADNTKDSTNDMIANVIPSRKQKNVSIGNGAGTFNIGLDYSINELNDEDVVYFLENDYVHRNASYDALLDGVNIGADYVTLYDHPDKYKIPSEGGNPFCEDGAEESKVYLGNVCHWKLTNSTTMTFAAKVKTLKDDLAILKHFTTGTHPYDFEMFLKLREKGKSLVSPLPGFSTHGETAHLTPLIDWKNEI